MKQELLAPAGDIEAAYAALFYGADALYLGLRQFSARASATNFSPDELCQITGYAHALGRKIYVTVNTLVQQEQLKDLTQTLDACLNAGVDGLIVQDLGVAKIVRDCYPELELHASTQMAVHNKEGALFLKKMGFKRVVLSRELTLNEIKQITAIPDLETEAFIHGALCYAYSGLCLFSSMETSMSANRGKCLYPCRGCFAGDLGNKHLFSMKDMALQEDVLKMPVTSLKIEGRKKTALYVAAVTNYYRRLLDKKNVDSLADDIKQIFARPWTKLHFNGKNKDVTDTEFVGHRGLLIGKVSQVARGILTFKTQHPIARYDGIQIDVKGDEKPFGFSLEKMRVQSRPVFEAEANSVVEITLPKDAPFIEKGDNVYLASSSRVKGAYHYESPKPDAFKFRMPIDVKVVADEHKCTAFACDKTAEITGDFEKAKNPAKVFDAVHQAFDKTGDTALKLVHLDFQNPANMFLPASQLNELRRALYAQIEPKLIHRALPELGTGHKRASDTPRWIIRTDDENLALSLDLSQIDELIFVLNPQSDLSALRSLPKNKIRLALPTVARQVTLYKPLIAAALAAGYKKWEVGNYWALTELPSKGVSITFDNTLYVLNTQAIDFAHQMSAERVTLSVEDTAENLQTLAQGSILPTALIVYQDTPLFTSVNCIRPNACKDCTGGVKTYHLAKDGHNYTAISAARPCQTVVIDNRAYALPLDKAKSVNADYYRIDFVNKTYTPEQANQIVKNIMSARGVEHTHTANWEKRI